MRDRTSLLRRAGKLAAVACPTSGASLAERETARRLAERLWRALGEMGGGVAVMVGGRTAFQFSANGAAA